MQHPNSGDEGRFWYYEDEFTEPSNIFIMPDTRVDDPNYAEAIAKSREQNDMSTESFVRGYLSAKGVPFDTATYHRSLS
jgi:hypothetical protein